MAWVTLRVDGWPVCRFEGLDMEVRVPAEMVEVIEG